MSSRPPVSANRWHEVLLGRSLAACIHPVAAWQSKARSFRALVVAGYFTAGYIAALATILLVG